MRLDALDHATASLGLIAVAMLAALVSRRLHRWVDQRDARLVPVRRM